MLKNRLPGGFWFRSAGLYCGAQFYSSALSKVHIDPLRCFGCGVCRAVCPRDAIELIPRQEHPEAANLWLK